jgi:predicted phage tail component-like protein
MTSNSFTYNGVDVFEIARLRIIHYDVFSAPLRARKVLVPGRSGMYDYGAEYHDERQLRMECLIDGAIEDAQFDELKYVLSRKGRRIILWDKPDRYYVGQCYDAAEVLDYYHHYLREFELVFQCEPYAYAIEATVLTSDQPIIFTQYEGTRQAPTRITIRNTGSAPLSGVTITAREVK